MKDDCCDIFKVLGVDTRLKILELLKDSGPLGANNIARIVGVTPAAVSQHLRVMKQAGMVRSERRGYFIPYEIDKKGLENCCHKLIEVCTCGCGETAPFLTKQLGKCDLKELKKYKGALQKELDSVREAIEKANQKKK